MSDRQRTLEAPVELKGVGLHTGEPVELKIMPAPAGHGYKFQRIDLEERPVIDAHADNVVTTERGTTLEQNGARVYTTEHVLAALYGMQVDNALYQHALEREWKRGARRARQAGHPLPIEPRARQQVAAQAP